MCLVHFDSSEAIKPLLWCFFWSLTACGAENKESHAGLEWHDGE